MGEKITVEIEVKAAVEEVWKLWTTPEDIKNWNNASDDWHTTRAENDLRKGGKFLSRMEAKDGSFGFDFEGTGGATNITTEFDAESENPVEMQKNGWQAILNNFKRYSEKN